MLKHPSPALSAAPATRSDPLTDGGLVGRARAGDEAAFGELVRRHQARARALARALIGDRHEAEDLAQEAFVRAHRNLDLLADPERFASWLARIVTGVSIDWLRTFRQELWRMSDAPGSGGMPEVPAPTLQPLDLLVRAELADRVLAAIHALPDRYRVPLSLFHLEGLSQARVAEALGVPAGTVRSLVTRARQRLRVLLTAYAYDCADDATEDRRPDAPPAGAGARAGDDVRAAAAFAADVFDSPPAPRLLHVLNGDCVRVKLEEAGIPGTLAVWADALHDGPVPSLDTDAARWREIRAGFAAGAGWASYEDAVATYARWDAGIEEFRQFDELVFWFEHDLFDQLLLIRHLAWLARQESHATEVSLICIGAWPGMPEFKGLGELTPSELASLLGTRQRVSQRQLALGRRAWQAFTGDDPRAIERLLATQDTSPLPFLAGALRRHLEEFPGVRDGLGRTERQILSLVAAGTTALAELFPAVHRLEAQFFIGDVSFIRLVRGLGGGAHPLLQVNEGAGRWWEDGTVALTDAGRAVLDGHADAVRLNGTDVWRGGVHLRGAEAAWRWDAEQGRLA